MSAKRDEAAKRERPILFSGPMVRAILDGKKTQTRRVVKDLKPDDSYIEAVCLRRRPYGAPGDRLWVRETWASLHFHRDWESGHIDDWEEAANLREGRLVFDADPHCWNENGNSAEARGFAWRPSIFMPRWASRLSLEITDVRVERLQSITNADAIAEGCTGGADVDGYSEANPADPYEEYANLWDSLNAKRGYGWNVNPWVWVIEFRPLSERAS